MSSDTETDSDDNEFQQDILALKRACSIKTHDVISPKSSDDESESDYDEDMELLRDIKKRFKDYGGDFETLRAIQRSTGNGMESSVQRSEKQVGATNIIDLGKESSPNSFLTRINNRQGFPDSVDGRAANNHISSNINSAANVSEGHEPGSELVPVGDCGFPASAQAFVEAIKKNRTYQKFLRDKLIQVEARLEENKKLRERVKFLKGFQVDCRKRTGRALSHKKDPRFQLISVPKLRANASKVSPHTADIYCFKNGKSL
ncbi:Homeodomain-like protein [Artemisia annua]|uniref:Homeodomain-like protein n=1 Tax=Artemisia annua TaxID=35608 RepID=A0A2U1LD14_ARTAN|nr:Homeodomain-like protein [Artemisia annua]